MRKHFTSILHWEVDLKMLKDCLIVQLPQRSCIYTLANSYQIWKMTSYHSLLIAYAFIFFKTLPSYITGQMVPHVHQGLSLSVNNFNQKSCIGCWMISKATVV